MRIALTQMDIVWEDKEANKKICERLMEKAAKEGAEIIVFPEMTLTGFTMRPELFGEEQDETFQYFSQLSKGFGLGVVYGTIEKYQEKYYNTLEMIADGKKIMKYRKIHPFTYGGEKEHYASGEWIEIADWNGHQVGGFICYDLRFPENFQESSKKSELIFVIANWPEERIEQWKVLLRARAIENQCFIVGVNRKGQGRDLRYVPSSYVITPYGNILNAEGCSEEMIVADIDWDMVKQYRQCFPVKDDRRPDVYRRNEGLCEKNRNQSAGMRDIIADGM